MPLTAKEPLTLGCARSGLRGHDFVIPALTLGQTESLEAEIDKLSPNSQESFTEVLKSAARVLLVALSENYPAITLEEVKNLLDLSNYGNAFRASLGQDAPGETRAAASTPTRRPRMGQPKIRS